MKFNKPFLAASLFALLCFFSSVNGYAGEPIKKSTQKKQASSKIEKKTDVPEQSDEAMKTLVMMRDQVDKLDDQLIQLLEKRMLVTNEIGRFKKEHNMPIEQPNRYEEILDKRVKQGVGLGMDGNFVKVVMDAIHEESVRQQNKIVTK